MKVVPRGEGNPDGEDAEGGILVIDDSELARQMLCDLLEGAGHRVVSLPSPIGATRKALHEALTVVVIDVDMPGMPGDKLASLFRQHRRLDHLGIVLVSGTREAELRDLAERAGADASVPKSRLDTDLTGTVERVAARARARGPQS
ncbi:MAG: response regulator [Polyangiales bacterium]